MGDIGVEGISMAELIFLSREGVCGGGGVVGGWWVVGSGGWNRYQ